MLGWRGGGDCTPHYHISSVGEEVGTAVTVLGWRGGVDCSSGEGVGDCSCSVGLERGWGLQLECWAGEEVGTAVTVLG
jgi:hypothetical protein